MPDDVERAAVLTDAWVERCLGARLRTLHQPGALECEGCGEPIPERRRAAMPSATRCAPCQEAMEKPRVR
jgi:phage/conjugal plasmid C-4 type zinc finger TraR family protein